MIPGIQNIAILTGWTWSEREISLRSAWEVEHVLLGAGYMVTTFDIPVDLTRFIQRYKEFHFAFVLIHGKLWEDGKIPALLELLKLPFQWSPSESHAVSLNKIWAKAIIAQAGWNTARYQTLHFYKHSWLEILEMIEQNGWFPCVIKKPKEWSTIGVYIMRNLEDFEGYKQELEYIQWPVMYEEYLEWREFTASVLERSNNGEVQALPVIEIIPPDGWYFDFENKYNGMTKEVCPVDIDRELRNKIEALALLAHKTLWAQWYSRTDIIVVNNEPIFLELNTIPWFTNKSLYPQSASCAGMTFLNLLEELMCVWKERYRSLWF